MPRHSPAIAAWNRGPHAVRPRPPTRSSRQPSRAPPISHHAFLPIKNQPPLYRNQTKSAQFCPKTVKSHAPSSQTPSPKSDKIGLILSENGKANPNPHTPPAHSSRQEPATTAHTSPKSDKIGPNLSENGKANPNPHTPPARSSRQPPHVSPVKNPESAHPIPKSDRISQILSEYGRGCGHISTSQPTLSG